MVVWLWDLGTLVPVIGLVQVDDQSMADRYTYIPLIGLFIIISWGISEFGVRWRRAKIIPGIAAAVLPVFEIFQRSHRFLRSVLGPLACHSSRDVPACKGENFLMGNQAAVMEL